MKTDAEILRDETLSESMRNALSGQAKSVHQAQEILDGSEGALQREGQGQARRTMLCALWVIDRDTPYNGQRLSAAATEGV